MCSSRLQASPSGKTRTYWPQLPMQKEKSSVGSQEHSKELALAKEGRTLMAAKMEVAEGSFMVDRKRLQWRWKRWWKECERIQMEGGKNKTGLVQENIAVHYNNAKHHDKVSARQNKQQSNGEMPIKIYRRHC
jgi:hypothetical protein